MKKLKLNILLVFVSILLLFAMQYKGLVYTTVYPVFRGFSDGKLERSISSYDRIAQDNYNIYYANDNEQDLTIVKDTVDLYGNAVFKFFDYPVGDKVGIVVYDNKEDFHKVLGISMDKPTMGAYYGGKINLLSPHVLEQGGYNTDALANVFVHELAHYTIDMLAKGNYPLWFTEGSALYIEYDLLGYEWGNNILEMQGISIDDLTNRFSDLDEYEAYRQSFVYIKRLIDRYGKDNYILLINELGKGRSFEQALQSTLGIISSDLEME